MHKTFRLPHQRYSTLKERVLHPFASMTFDELRALQAVDVTVKRGEFFGIVGRNGSGKSTMLKCLAGVYQPDRGSVTVRGRLSPFIELGVGFNPDLTARDNVVINAVMMGLSRREARRRFDEIIAFAELEEFIDLRLKNYSSGMSVRLGFATAIQVDADVLLVDEVLAVGDAAFQQKCFEAFIGLKAAGKTIVFVTHDMGAVQRFCDRALLLERGEVLELGEPRLVARGYNELNFGRLGHTGPDQAGREGARLDAEITDCWFERTDTGEPITQVEQTTPVACVMDVVFHADVDGPTFTLTLRNEAAHTVFSTSSQWLDPDPRDFRAGERCQVRLAFDCHLAPSHYKATPSVARGGSGADALDVREDLLSLYVHAFRHSGGTVDLPTTFSLDVR